MPRFYFEFHDSDWDRDISGTELPGFDEVLLEDKRTLLALTIDDLSNNGDRHAITMVVSDEDGRPVYTATLAYTGLVLAR